MVAIPKKDGGVRITINYKKSISSLGQLPIPRVDEILDSLGKGRIFSLFDLVSSFYQIIIDKDTIPLTAFCTPDRLFEWLVMLQGSSAAPGWFVKVINQVTKGLERVAAYLDDHRLRYGLHSPHRQHPSSSNAVVSTTSSSPPPRPELTPPRLNSWATSPPPALALTPTRSLP